jgi:fatty acid desaturase
MLDDTDTSEEKKLDNNSGGIGCLTIVGIVFITLKLLGVAPVAAWSWWWVTAPLWGPLAFVLVIVALMWVVAHTLGGSIRVTRR